MKFLAVFLVLAFVAVAMAKPAEVEKIDSSKVDDVKAIKTEEAARDKRGVLVETYTAPYAYSPYTVPVSYAVPYSYSYNYQTHPTYYSSPLVYY